MTAGPDWASDEIDLERPSVARVHDYFLGGDHNFEADRALAAEIERQTPTIGVTMRAGRDFLRRAVRHLLACGIDQFLDLGSGIPTAGNVHQIAHAINPQAHVVYVDVDPVVVVHSQAILAGDPRTAIIHADTRDAATVLAHPEFHRLIDRTRPLGLLFAGILHFIPDEDDPAAVVGRYLRAAAPGSHLALSHTTADGQPPELAAAWARPGRTTVVLHLRDHAAVLAMFNGLPLVEPGLVPVARWRPDPDADLSYPEHIGAYAGLARKP